MSNKIVKITFILLFSVSCFAYAELKKPIEPVDITYNGHTWKSHTTGDKISFLQGFYQGAFYGAVNCEANKEGDEKQIFFDTINAYAYPEEGDLKAASKAVDEFYSDESNLVIPVHEALVFIAKEKSNANMIEEQRTQWLKRAREYWKDK